MVAIEKKVKSVVRTLRAAIGQSLSGLDQSGTYWFIQDSEILHTITESSILNSH